MCPVFLTILDYNFEAPYLSYSSFISLKSSVNFWVLEEHDHLWDKPLSPKIFNLIKLCVEMVKKCDKKIMRKKVLLAKGD